MPSFILNKNNMPKLRFRSVNFFTLFTFSASKRLKLEKTQLLKFMKSCILVHTHTHPLPNKASGSENSSQVAPPVYWDPTKTNILAANCQPRVPLSSKSITTPRPLIQQKIFFVVILVNLSSYSTNYINKKSADSVSSGIISRELLSADCLKL